MMHLPQDAFDINCGFINEYPDIPYLVVDPRGRQRGQTQQGAFDAPWPITACLNHQLLLAREINDLNEIGRP